MSSKKIAITGIVKRILTLSTRYSTDKAFILECGIANLSFITDLKKGRTKTPGADKLAQIVRGTGCSGTWLLTGEGEMFSPDQTQEDAFADPGEHYAAGRIMQALRLLESLEVHRADLKGLKLPPGVALQSARLTALLLEFQQGVESGKDS